MNTKPGINSEKFTLTMQDSVTNLIIGEDIDIVGEPELKGDTVVYTIKMISEKALKYINNAK